MYGEALETAERNGNTTVLEHCGGGGFYEWNFRGRYDISIRIPAAVTSSSALYAVALKCSPMGEQDSSSLAPSRSLRREQESK
jgi:hypothetical protein